MPFIVVDERGVSEPVDFREELDYSQKAAVDECPHRDGNKVTEAVLPGRAQTEQAFAHLPSEEISLCCCSLCLCSHLSVHFQLNCRGFNTFDFQFDRLGPLEALSSLQ